VIAITVGFVSVIVRREAPFTPITGGAKLFATVMSLLTINTPAPAGEVFPPALAVVTSPTGIVFV